MDRKLTFSFYGKDVSAGRTMHGIAGQTETLRSKSLAAAKTVGILAGGTAIAGLTSALKTGFGEVKDYQAGLAQLRAGLKSTHDVSGTTVKGMEALASRIQNYSGQTDDSIVATEQLLLTFPNIRNEAGKTNDIFDQTTKIAADMAARMGGDASGAAIQLGKALNDPVKGITALTRVGVSFTDQQKEQIAALVKNGDTMKAQKVILRELNTEFGGSARQFGKTLPGQIERTKRAYEGIAQELATDVLPYALKFTKWVRKDAIPALEDFGGWVKSHKTELEWFAGIIGGLAVGFKAFKGVRSIQALVGRGPLAGGGGLLGGAASMAKPIPVYVTNPGGLPGGGAGGPVPVGAPGAKGPSPIGGAKLLPVAGVGANSDTRSGMDALRSSGISPQDTYNDSLRIYQGMIKQADGIDKVKTAYQASSAALKAATGDERAYAQATHDALRQVLSDAGALQKYAGIVGNGIGTDLGKGLIAGIESQIPHATTAGKLLVSLTAKQMRLAADAHSPSRVTMALGKDLADGLFVGFTNVKVWDKLAVDTRHGLMELSRDAVRARDYQSNFRGGLIGYASLSGASSSTSTGLFGASTTTPPNTRAYLRSRVQRLHEFRVLRERLDRRGASPALLAEYDALGPDAVPEMRADLRTGRQGIQTLDRLEARARHLAGATAADATQGRYGEQLHHDLERLPDRIAHRLAQRLEHMRIITDREKQDRKNGRHVRRH